MALICLTGFAQRQYTGRCGDYHYRFNGKMISNISLTTPDGDKVKIINYYKIDVLNDYLWFWTEEIDENLNRTVKFTTSWARLSDLDTSLLNKVNTDKQVRVSLLSDQRYFFQTIFVRDKRGPSYTVANAMNLRFNRSEEVAGFVGEFSAVLKTEYTQLANSKRHK